MGVVAVYALNDEFKSIRREAKNGVVNPISYILAKTILVIPIMGAFSIFAIGIPGYAIKAFEPSSPAVAIGIYTCVIYVFEYVAESFAVLFDDPILGMLGFTNFWFSSFLFGGFYIPLTDLFWPFKAFHDVLPFGYFLRSMSYVVFIDAEWEPCTDPTTSTGVCVNSTDGKDVLDGLSVFFPVVESENRVGMNLLIVLAIALFFKLITIVTIIFRTNGVASIGFPGHPSSPRPTARAAPPPETALATRAIMLTAKTVSSSPPATPPPTEEVVEIEC